MANGEGNGGGFLLTASKAIRDIGFPIVVTLILLFQFGPKMDALTRMVEKLVIIMESKR